jgi:hypothetical protein
MCLKRFSPAAMLWLATLLTVPIFLGSALAQHGSLIYTFGLSPGDGYGPNSSLIADATGNLYGSTYSNSDNTCCGTVFELSPPVLPSAAWTETVLYSFAGGTDGEGPAGSPVFDAAGNLLWNHERRRQSELPIRLRNGF